MASPSRLTVAETVSLVVSWLLLILLIDPPTAKFSVPVPIVKAVAAAVLSKLSESKLTVVKSSEMVYVDALVASDAVSVAPFGYPLSAVQLVAPVQLPSVEPSHV